jgi:hypothetical protein
MALAFHFQWRPKGIPLHMAEKMIKADQDYESIP